MFSEVPDFEAWFPDQEGFPRPDWKAIREWFRLNVKPDQLDIAWPAITRVWLQKICERMAGSYTVAESQNFHLLSELDEKQRGELLTFLENARARILRALCDIPIPKRHGKHVVLRFTEQDDYYRYIAAFDAAGEYAGSSGRFLPHGYMHIAYPHSDSPGEDRMTLAHELTHNLLRSFPLPVWLNEALAMAFEQDLAGSGGRPLLTRELFEEHRAYWNSETIQEFWRGPSFSKVDGQKLSYHLARILLDFIATDLQPPPAQFRDFVLHADRKDAGESAALDYLGTDLNDLVATFLGPGQWTPKPVNQAGDAQF